MVVVVGWVAVGGREEGGEEEGSGLESGPVRVLLRVTEGYRFLVSGGWEGGDSPLVLDRYRFLASRKGRTGEERGVPVRVSLRFWTGTIFSNSLLKEWGGGGEFVFECHHRLWTSTIWGRREVGEFAFDFRGSTWRTSLRRLGSEGAFPTKPLGSASCRLSFLADGRGN